MVYRRFVDFIPEILHPHSERGEEERELWPEGGGLPAARVVRAVFHPADLINESWFPAALRRKRLAGPGGRSMQPDYRRSA